jgi:hypothetical protein
VPTPIADINRLVSTSASGSWSGHIIGSVFNAGAQYVAAGGLNATYNFGSGAGSFSVLNYDSFPPFRVDFTKKLSPGSTSYSFSFSNPSGLPLKGSVNGGFFGPNAKDTGGNFSFSGTAGSPYFTSGIFAATKK